MTKSLSVYNYIIPIPSSAGLIIVTMFINTETSVDCLKKHPDEVDCCRDAPAAM